MSVMRYKQSNLPPLTDKQEKEIAALEAMPDSAIDCSDIPELTENELENAVQGRFYRPVKKNVTLRRDRMLHG